MDDTQIIGVMKHKDWTWYTVLTHCMCDFSVGDGCGEAPFFKVTNEIDRVILESQIGWIDGQGRGYSRTRSGKFRILEPYLSDRWSGLPAVDLGPSLQTGRDLSNLQDLAYKTQDVTLLQAW